MRNLTPTIKNILANNPKARDSDGVLIIEMIRKLGVYMTDAQEEKLKSMNFESIRRTRQRIQALGEYTASPEVQKARKHKSLVVQQNAPTAKPERLEQLIQVLPWGQG